MKMKICLVSEEYPEETNYGGIATYQKRLAETLVKLGHSVYVIARALKDDQEYNDNGVNVIRIAFENTNDIFKKYEHYRKRISKKLHELVEQGKIEIIESPDWGGETAFYCGKRKVPLVIRLHTPLVVWTEFNKSGLGDEVQENVLEWEKKTMEDADVITSCTEILKGLVIEKIGIDKDNIIVIPNPGDTSKFYPIEGAKKRNTIIYCGSVEQRKGVLVLAQALEKVFKEFEDLEIMFVGKDTVRNDKDISTMKYIKEIVPEEYRNRLKFYGQLGNEELNKLYNEAKLAVFPSLFDNLPYVVLEAMLAKLPIVGSRNSGMPEMFIEGESGDLYETGNPDSLAEKIIDLLNDLERMNLYGKNAREKALRDFDAGVIAKQMVDIYEKARDIYSGRVRIKE